MTTPLYPLSSTLYPRRLLVRGVNWIGDAVMTTPALLRLREALPQTHITLLTHEKLAGLWTGHPAVDEVITFGPGESVFSIARRLRAWRERENLSQSEAALKLQISKRTLQEWEQGRAVPHGLARTAVDATIRK